MTEADVEAPPALIVERLTKRYGGVVALDAVSLVVSAGSAYGLVGPNGGGKTTLLRVLAMLERPSAGSVRVLGLDPVANPSSVRRIVGYAGPPVGTPELTVGEEMAAAARLGGVGAIERDESIAAMLQIVDLYDRRHRRVAELSRGDRKRLAIARALVHDPALLLLDGPFEGLDGRAQGELRAVLAELSSLGKTLVVAAGTLAELAGLSHAVGVLDAGRLVASGSIETLVESADPAVAALLLAQEGLDPGLLVGAAGSALGSADPPRC